MYSDEEIKRKLHLLGVEISKPSPTCKLYKSELADKVTETGRLEITKMERRLTMAKQEDTFEPGTLIPRGMYIRKCEVGIYNKQHFAKCADKERDLRLQMMEPTNWLSQFFAKEPYKEELQKFAGSLAAHLSKAGYDTAELDDWFMQHLM